MGKLVMLVALLAQVCFVGLSGAQAEERTSIKIGMTVSSTGSYAEVSQSGERGVGIWLDDVNARGGIELDGKKYPVELVKRDDRSDKQLVGRVYDSLINEEKVDALIAPFSSTLVGVSAPIADSGNKLMVSWAGSSDTLFQQGYKTLVSVTAQASQIPVTSIDLAAKLGVKKIAIIYVDDAFPAGAAQAAKALSEKAGLQVVLFEKYPKGAKDFSILLQKAKSAGAEALYTTSLDADLITMLRQLHEREIDFSYIYMLYGSLPSVLQSGKDSQYILSNTQFDPSVNFSVTDGLTTSAFLAAYSRLYPKAQPADYETALAYGAGVVLEKAIKTAHSLDTAKLKQAALDISGTTTVLCGKYEIDQTGFQHGMDALVLQSQPDGLKVVAPEAVATAKTIFPMPTWDKR